MSKDRAKEGLAMLRTPLVLALLLLAWAASAEVFFQETFDDESWTSRWEKSRWKVGEDKAGDFTLSAGRWYGDEKQDQGLQTVGDRKYFGLFTELNKTLDTQGKDLVLQYSVKHEQNLATDCAGGYIKLLPETSAKRMWDFGTHTPFTLMFGPDVCGTFEHRVQLIIVYKGDEKTFVDQKKWGVGRVPAKVDQLTHVYTLVIKPDNTYQILIDLEEVASGSLEVDLGMLPPKTIKDPNAKKPKDWDERETIPDKTHKKPKGWDDIPMTIPDPDITKPEDWDDVKNGPFDPPEIPNPEYKGEWVRRRIPNPNYKGPWAHPEIPNPRYAEDHELYRFKNLKYLGFELWQVKAGSIFDNVILTDDLAEAKRLAEETWGQSREKERQALLTIKEEELAAKAAADAAAKKAELERVARVTKLLEEQEREAAAAAKTEL